MSYISAIKNLLSVDLKALIHHMTGLDESDNEFAKIEKKSWCTVMNQNYVSVTDDEVKKTLYEFGEKFIFHGFPIKAKNLKKLIEKYSNLQYFQTCSDPTLQWNVIDLLIKLSHKPTNFDLDDELLDVATLGEIPEKEEEFIDWGTYLKEGWDKFGLPSSDEESWSSIDSDTKKELEKPAVMEPISLVGCWKCTKKYRDRKNSRLEGMRKDEISMQWLEQNFEQSWWKDPDIRIHPTSTSLHATWLFHWEEKMKKKKIEFEKVRVITEHNVIRELLMVLCHPPDPPGTFIIRNVNGEYNCTPRISISSISPPLFAEIIDTHFCKYLTSIRELNKFIETATFSYESITCVPFTYIAYARGLQKIFRNYKLKLSEIEIRNQTCTYTILHLFNDLREWFKQLDYIYSVHCKAIIPNYEIEENWKCSLRLLSILYNELFFNDSRNKKTIFELFLYSFRTYLQIINGMLSDLTSDFKNEFLLYKSKDRTIGIEFREYIKFLEPIGGSCVKFWTTLCAICKKTLSGKHCLSHFGKKINSLNEKSILDLFFNELFDEISSFLISLFPDFKRTFPTKPVTPARIIPLQRNNFKPFIPKRELFFLRSLEKHNYYNAGKIILNISNKTCFDYTQEETILDCFMKDLAQYDLTLLPLLEFIHNSSITAIQKNLIPYGVLSSIIFGEFKLLDYLQCLWKVVFININPMVSAIFKKLFEVSSSRPESISFIFKKSIFDYLPYNIIHMMNITTSTIPLSAKDHDFSEKIDCLSLIYEVPAELKMIITEDMLVSYNKIFKFLLKSKYAFRILLKLKLNSFKSNTESAKRLISLRMWLLHTSMTFQSYFSYFGQEEFLISIKDICEESKDIFAMNLAHKNFVSNCEIHCFFDNKAEKSIKQLFELCETFNQHWYLEEQGLSQISDIIKLEESYLILMHSLGEQLELLFISTFKNSSRFLMLHNEILYNLPTKYV